jgi:hypothetical protein
MDLRRRSLVLVALVLSSRVDGAGSPGAASAPRGARTVLGDLSGFRAIAADALRIAQTGDLATARARMKELEEGWERAEPKMKPLAPDQWKKVDSAIDRARRELRFWRAKRTDSVESLQALIDTIDALGTSAPSADGQKS